MKLNIKKNKLDRDMVQNVTGKHIALTIYKQTVSIGYFSVNDNQRLFFILMRYISIILAQYICSLMKWF